MPSMLTAPVLAAACSTAVINQRRLSEDEVAVLNEAICGDYETSGLSSGDALSEDARSDPARKMTDRELIGAILASRDDLIWSPGYYATPMKQTKSSNRR